jgi:hypothetical protein
MPDHGDIKPIDRKLAVAALVDVEDQSHVAYALARTRCQRCGGRHKARAHHIAVAILEIIAG